MQKKRTTAREKMGREDRVSKKPNNKDNQNGYWVKVSKKKGGSKITKVMLFSVLSKITFNIQTQVCDANK